MYRRMVKAGLLDEVPRLRRQLARVVATNRILGCSSSRPKAGCRVVVHFQAHVMRIDPLTHAFAQMLLGSALAQRDHNVVSINLVGPEDGPVALADYRIHMRMLRFLRRLYPRSRLALHAAN